MMTPTPHRIRLVCALALTIAACAFDSTADADADAMGPLTAVADTCWAIGVFTGLGAAVDDEPRAVSNIYIRDDGSLTRVDQVCGQADVVNHTTWTATAGGDLEIRAYIEEEDARFSPGASAPWKFDGDKNLVVLIAGPEDSAVVFARRDGELWAVDPYVRGAGRLAPDCTDDDTWAEPAPVPPEACEHR